MKKILVVSTAILISIGSLQAHGAKGGKGGKTVEPPFVDGFNDEITFGLLCPWEQLNPCEGRKEVFVLDETKKANGNNYYYDYDLAQLEHIDVCMNERDAPTGRTLYELSAKPINLDSENGCHSPCQMLLRAQYINRLSCHENIALDQSQDIIEQYWDDGGIDFVKQHTRNGDNYFCHENFLPTNVTPEECLASTSKYCFRGLQAGETGDEYEEYLEQCLSEYWQQ